MRECSIEGCGQTRLKAKGMCATHYHQAWRSANPERWAAIRSRARDNGTSSGPSGVGRGASAVGFSWADVHREIEARDGRCDICGLVPAKRLNVDHDHQNGAFRGMLCRECNLGLAHFADDPLRLEAAAAYLRESWSRSGV